MLFAGGDSVVWQMSRQTSRTGWSSFRFLFRRSTLPRPAVTTGLYVLTAINGRGAPLVLYDTVMGTNRLVRRVPYDSFTFLDGVFFRQHRMDRAVMYFASGDSLTSFSELTEVASYRGQGNSLVLHHAVDPRAPHSQTHDVLTLEQQQLVRRRVGTLVTDVDQYSRQP
jgi:hypothetical protein